MIKKNWTVSISAFISNPWVRGILLVLYYLAIIAGLILMYGKGNFSTPEFIYQGF
jgi:membrane-bound ClpP family serine protease